MIERYALYETQNLRDRFALPNGVPSGIKQRYNISPAQLAPVVVLRDGNRVMELMQWGFVPQGAKDTNSVFRYKTFNVRSEDVFKRATWEKAIRSQRCVVPVNGYYLWQPTEQGKQPYYVQGRDSIMALAGMYSTWTTPEGALQAMFTIVTVPSHDELYDYAQRSPVLLDTEEKIVSWLDTTSGDATSIYNNMRMPKPGSLTLHAVGRAVNSVKAEGPQLIA